MGEFLTSELPQESSAEQSNDLRPPTRRAMIRSVVKGVIAGPVVLTAMVVASFAIGPDNPAENFIQNIKAIPEIVEKIEESHAESTAALLLGVPYVISMATGAAAGLAFGVEPQLLEDEFKKMANKFRRPSFLNTIS